MTSLEQDKDINDVFNDILLVEEKLIEEGYKEGFTQGSTEGNPEGFHLGYHRGAELGAEVGYYSAITESYLKHFENNTSVNDKVVKTLNCLSKLIETFPQINSEEVDILKLVGDIRAKFKKLCAQLKIDAAFPETDKLSF